MPRCRVVGVSSLLLDERQGTDGEKHVVFVDLDDREKVETRWEAFTQHLHRVSMRWGVGCWHLFRTLKGYHLFSPYLFSRRGTERIEEDLEAWGGDGFHRFMGYVNGQTVLRVTRKPGEPEGGPEHVRSFRYSLIGEPRRRPDDWEPRRAEWSAPHQRFFEDLHDGLPSPPWGDPTEGSGEVRLEEYTTTAKPQEGD